MLLLRNGMTAYRQYKKQLKKDNNNVFIRVRYYDRADGTRWEKEYFTKFIRRTQEEFERLVQQGKDPNSPSTRYYEVIIDEPEHFKRDQLAYYFENDFIQQKGRDLLVENQEILGEITRLCSYFDGLTVYELSN